MVDLHDARSVAARVAARADVVDVRLFHVDASLERLPDLSQRLSYSFDANVEVQLVEETSSIIVEGAYDLKVVNLPPDEDDDAPSGDGEAVSRVAFKMAALFSVDQPTSGAEPFTDEELDAFAKTTGQLALHPYAREFIFDITGRMGLPALHVGMMYIPLDKRNEDGAAAPQGDKAAL